MLNELPGIYFLDIETACQSYPELTSEHMFLKKFWRVDEMGVWGTNDGQLKVKELWADKAPLTAEFGKIVCISIGTLVKVKSEVEGGPDVPKFFIKTFANVNEKVLLTEFAASMDKAKIICAHNGLNFDFPFITRRMIIHGIPLPAVLSRAGKIWDIKDKHLDTMEMFGCGEWGYRISLDLLCNILELPSPKKDLSGDQVNALYWSIFEKSDELVFDRETRILKQIGDYCSMDMFACAQAFTKIKGLELIEESQIEYR